MRMKILYISDLHGNWKFYERVLEIAKDLKVDMVINGGDLLPKSGDLYTEQKYFIDNLFKEYLNRFETLKKYYLFMPGNDDLGVFNKELNVLCEGKKYVKNIGLKCVKVGGYEFIGFNYVKDYKFRLKDWCRVEDDKFELETQLGTGLKCVKVGGYEFIGFNYVKDYKFRLKDWCRVEDDKFELETQLGTGLITYMDGADCRYKEIEDWKSYVFGLPSMRAELQKLVKPKNKKKAIYVIHNPPVGIDLGIIYGGLDKGSQAVYDFIKEKQPLFCLSGHIHENFEITGRYYNHIGKTLCVNPGQLSSLVYVNIELENKYVFRREEM
jgi:Icc-related predicted phosphoesterase